MAEHSGCFSDAACSFAPLPTQQANGGLRICQSREVSAAPQPTPACSGPLVASCHLTPHFLKPGLRPSRMPCWWWPSGTQCQSAYKGSCRRAKLCLSSAWGTPCHLYPAITLLHTPQGSLLVTARNHRDAAGFLGGVYSRAGPSRGEQGRGGRLGGRQQGLLWRSWGR